MHRICQYFHSGLNFAPILSTCIPDIRKRTPGQIHRRRNCLWLIALSYCDQYDDQWNLSNDEKPGADPVGGPEGPWPPPPALAKCPRFWTKCPLNLGKSALICIKVPHESGQNAPHSLPKCPTFAPKWPINYHLRGKFSKFSGGAPPDPPNYMPFSLNIPFKCKPHMSLCAGKLPSDLDGPPSSDFLDQPLKRVTKKVPSFPNSAKKDTLISDMLRTESRSEKGTIFMRISVHPC